MRRHGEYACGVSKAAVATDEAGGGGGDRHNLVTTRDDEAYEVIGSLARSSNNISLARASVRRGPVARYRRVEGLSALILRGRGILPQCRDADDPNLCRLRYNWLAALAGLTTPDYTLSWPSEPAGYIIYDGCKCNI